MGPKAFASIWPTILADDSVKVPDMIAGQPVHTVVVGRFVDLAEPQAAVNPRVNQRPLVGGLSISVAAAGCVGSGTLGYFVHDSSQNLCLLSAGHVLDDETKKVIQQGVSDGGSVGYPSNIVADDIKSKISASDGVDAAYAKLVPGVTATLELNGLGKVDGIAPAAVGAAVKKSGKTTGVTSGTTIDVKAAISVGKDVFQHLIVIKPLGSAEFVASGDSGSLVVQEMSSGGLAAVGILKGRFASTGACTACQIDRVLNILNVTLAV